jgi:HK97 family phage major capsid protein
VCSSDLIVGGTGTGTTAIEGILSADSIGTATATAGTAVWGDLYPAIVNAIMDVAGSHYAGVGEQSIVMHPRRWGWILSQVDTDDRPLVGSVNAQNAPASFANVAGPESGGSVAAVGHLLGVPVYLDASIPTNLGSGTDEDRILVGAFKEAHLFTGAPVFGVSTEAEFLKDQTIVRVTQDVAFTAERYAGAFSVVSGTALNDT